MAEIVSNLMEANLLGVFNERDAQRRALTIASTYSADVRWTDDEGTSVGRQALEAKAIALQSQMQGLVFTKASPVYQTRGLGYLAWQLGPDGGDPVAIDVREVFGGQSVRNAQQGATGAGESRDRQRHDKKACAPGPDEAPTPRQRACLAEAPKARRRAHGPALVSNRTRRMS